MIISRNIVFKSEEPEYTNSDVRCATYNLCCKTNRKANYFKEISDIVKNYQDVVLFGPTKTKFEFYDQLKADKHFNKIKIECFNTNKMTESQMHDFVLDKCNQ